MFARITYSALKFCPMRKRGEGKLLCPGRGRARGVRQRPARPDPACRLESKSAVAHSGLRFGPFRASAPSGLRPLIRASLRPLPGFGPLSGLCFGPLSGLRFGPSRAAALSGLRPSPGRPTGTPGPYNGIPRELPRYE